MVNDFFLQKTIERFGFEPTIDQLGALNKIVNFIFSRNLDGLFLLKGYAGTGKSSLLGALAQTMREFKLKTVLLAPTGRAAKVFSNYAEQSATTIHKKIYRQQKFGHDDTLFNIMDNKYTDTLFIVDEVSMVSNRESEFSSFGTGRLLDDLIHFVYSGNNCKLLLIGDTAQLPPVMEEESPALDINNLVGYGLEVSESEMRETVRQSVKSGILYNATQIRKQLENNIAKLYPKLKLSGFTDIKQIGGDELIDELSSAYSEGIENTVIISRSNKRANIYNQGIRNSVLCREEELSTGDLLMINKNNYYWAEHIDGLDFLANGEIIEIIRIKKTQELYGFRFCDLSVRSSELDLEFDIKIILNSLYSETASLSREASRQLFEEVMNDYTDLYSKAAKLKRLKTDPFYNAIQVKFAYAVTCHKAQGGEWKNVFIDMGAVPEEFLGTNFYRWLYTAITRSTGKLYLINLPVEFL